MDPEYTPIPFRTRCNSGLARYRSLVDQDTGSYLEERTDPPVGDVSLRGIPFSIKGADLERCFLVPALADDGAIRVPVRKAVAGLIVAHVLLDSDLWVGAPAGRTVGTYRFEYEDRLLEVPIRERLEVGTMPLPWGQYPMLAVPDRHDAMEDQHHGQFARAGFRQTEVQPVSPAAYFLWYWRSPHPGEVLRSVTFESRDAGLLVAGLTASFVDEDPIGFRARTTARILLEGGATGGTPSVSVDRGVASYPLRLVEPALDASPDAHPGWGAPATGEGDAAWVEVAAAPSATIGVRAEDRLVGSARWGDVLRDGSARAGEARIEVLDPGRNWVRVTVVDEATGRPVPCRIAFQSPEGVPFAPHGHHRAIYSGLPNWNVDVGGDVRIGSVTYAYIDGRCEGWLPRGPVIVDIARGFEYEPLRIRTLIADDQRELRLAIRRWVDMNADGWYSGDTHVHFLSAQGALLEAAGEDLNVVNLLQTQWGHLFTNTEDFTGRPLRSPDRRHAVWVSQENREHILGHLGLLGLRRPVMPWTTGGPGEGELGGTVETTLSRWADAAHAQGALVVIAHFPTPNAEAAVLVATGRADAVEMYDQLRYEHEEYYRYLNDGYRLPLVAGTDKMSSGVPVGMYRTYVRLRAGEPFTFRSWARGIRHGATFISSGPILDMKVDGHPVGSVVRVPRGGRVTVEVDARSALPMAEVQLVERGRVIDRVQRTSSVRSISLRSEVRIDGPTWLAARCGGLDYEPIRHHDEQRRGIMAHTSPTYVATSPGARLRDRGTTAHMLELVRAGREYLSASAQFVPGTVTHPHGEADHRAYLEAPFDEAERRLLARLRTRST